MNDDNRRRIVFECSAYYNLCDEYGEMIEGAEAEAQISENDFSLLPKFGEAFFCPLRDIVSISDNDYKISLVLSSKEILTLSSLGYKHEDFLRILSKLYNKLILDDMLITDTLRKSGIKGEYRYFDGDGNERHGKCLPYLYETAILIIPEKGELMRVPYCDISTIIEENYQLTFKTGYGEKFIISQMGKKHDSFIRTLSEVVNELSIKVQTSLKELLPQANPSIIRRISRFMKEGKAAKRSDIETISPEIWNALEKGIEVIGIKEEYKFLETLSQKDKICIGLKKDLMGGMTGEYMWFLIPVYSTNHTAPGNAIAMEAGSTEGAGKATYFFRLISRKDYSGLTDMEYLHTACNRLLKNINRCMLAINFRREPIYLSDEKISEPRYKKYQYAIRVIPELRELRSLFIGRVIHSSVEQWKEDSMDLLKFNVNAKDDKVKWKKDRKRKQNTDIVEQQEQA